MKLSRTLALATDQCAELTYAGAMDFKDGIDKQEEYLWDNNGNMTRDRNKDIYSISYNVLNLPERIRYYDGHEVQYTYAADGRKLHVDYLLNLFPIIDDEWGSDPEPQPFPSPDSTGNLLSGGDGLNGGLPGQIDPIVFEPQVLMTRDWSGGHVYRNGVTVTKTQNSNQVNSCLSKQLTNS